MPYTSYSTALAVFAGTLLSTLGLTKELKIGLISDLHLHLRYHPQWGPYSDKEGGCMLNDGTHEAQTAPMGRYGCDSPHILINTMLDNLKRQHEKPDVIILTGDFIAHQTAKLYPDPNKELYALLLASHTGVVQLLAEHFPDTLILPAFGNNDNEFHDNPAPATEVDFFYNYMYDMWFRLLPGNVKNLSQSHLDSIKGTFMQGGYYRVDLTDEISYLAMNTLYYDSIGTEDFEHQGIGKTQMEWLIEQLSEQGDRKFILSSHIYSGARYNSFQMWHDAATQVYMELIEEFRDRIIIEVAGHDHFSSLRSHKINETEFFHNLFVAPSITAWYHNNPGVSSFKINDEMVPVQLRQTFLNLRPTIGQENPTPTDQLEFRTLDYEQQYGVTDLSAQSIYELAQRLSSDETLHKDYLIRKLGMDPSNPDEVEDAIQILLKKGIILKHSDPQTGQESISTWPQLCLMTQNLSVDAYNDCLLRDPSSQHFTLFLQ